MPSQAKPQLWIALPRLKAAGAFGARGKSADRRAERWAARQAAAGLAEQRHGGYYVSPQARLDSEQPVAMFLEHGPRPDTLGGHVLPEGHDQWGQADRARFIDTAALLGKFDAFAAERPTLSLEACASLFAADAGHARWAAERRLSLTYRALARYRERMTPGSPRFDGNIDARGRKKATAEARAATCSPEAWSLFKAMYLQESRLPVTEVYKVVAAQAGRQGWAWPSLRTVQLRVRRDIPLPERTYGRRGLQAFRAECLPKLQRDLSGIPAGAWWTFDTRVLDFPCRVPHHEQGWRAIRALLIAGMDLRSRRIVAWSIGERETTDTVLATYRDGAIRHGVPDEITMDNGKPYRASGGRGRFPGRSARDLSRERAAFEQLGVIVHYAEPRSPWSKSIERAFCTMANGFDKWQHTYCGGSPQTRPSGAERLRRDVMNLPTLDEVRAAFDVWLAEYHATPHTGDGMEGLSPNLAWEQHRGPIRKADPAVLDLVCARMVGPKVVGRDGIRHDNILFGNYDPQLFNLQGQKVLIRIFPDRADSIVVCDLEGRPLCEVSNERMRGVTQDERRTAAQHRARAKREIAKRVDLVRTALEDLPQTAARIKMEAAIKAEQAQRQHFDPPPAPPVTIVRPDLQEAATRIAKGRRRRGGRPPTQEELTDWAAAEEVREALEGGDPRSAAQIAEEARWEEYRAVLADFDELMAEPPRKEVAG